MFVGRYVARLLLTLAGKTGLHDQVSTGSSFFPLGRGLGLHGWWSLFRHSKNMLLSFWLIDIIYFLRTLEDVKTFEVDIKVNKEKTVEVVRSVGNEIFSKFTGTKVRVKTHKTV